MLIFWGGDRSFYISHLLSVNLDKMIEGVMTKNTSMVAIFDGRSGQGKTTLCSQVGCYINNKVKPYFEKDGLTPPTFTLDNLAWTTDQFVELLKKAKKGDIVIMDEAMLIGSRSTLSEMNRAIVQMMSMIRSKQIFVFFNVNSVFDLDKNLALHRADMLIHLYPKDGKFAARGSYMVVPEAGGKLKSLYINGKKFYDYSKARVAFIDNFSSFFPFDDTEYERRKQEAINSYMTSRTKTDKLKVMESRDRLIVKLAEDPNLSKDDIARVADVNVRTVYRALERQEEANKRH